MSLLDFVHPMLVEDMDGIDEVPSQVLADLQYVPMEVEDQMEHVVDHVVTHNPEEVVERNVDLNFEDATAFLQVRRLIWRPTEI